MDGKQSQTADPLSRMIAVRDEAERSDPPSIPLNSMTEQEFVERYSGTADESNTSRPDGLHCVYGKCQGIPHSANPCHPGCSFTMTCVSDLEVWRRQTAAPGVHIRSTDPERNPRVEERIAEAARHRLAGAQLSFLAKIARDRLGYANRHNESNAEMIGRLLNDYADRHPLVGATRYGE